MNLRRIPVLILLSALLNVSALGQTVKEFYRGTLIDVDDNSPLDNVICEGLNADQQLIAYTLSAENGSFSLEKNSHIRFIAFRLLGYERDIIPVSGIPEKNDWVVKLRKADFALKEVVVTVPPIEQSSDTIRYNVSSFLGQEDRYVSDVLRKLPGIKVADNGMVTYQGEAISKFYIEGRDLLGGQYNLATNNLTVDAISHVEVLENNQHIKALKGIVFSEKAALNLRLKKNYRVRPFGEVQAGVGCSPLLYDEKAFTSFLGSKVQAMANFKINNTGQYILDELKDKLEMNNLFTYEVLPEQFIFPGSPQNIPLERNRYLFNKTYLGSVNSLFALSENTELKINFSYGSDRSEQELFMQNNYNAGENSIEIKEQSSLVNKIDNYRLSAIIENNSTKRYIRNESVWFGNRERSNSSINTTLQDMKSFGKNHPTYIQNSLQTLIKYRNNKTIDIQSFLRYSENAERLFVEKEDEQDQNMEENFTGKYLVNRNQVTSSYNLFNQRMNIGLFLTYKQRDLTNDLIHGGWNEFIPKELNLQNLADKTQWVQAGVSPSYQIRSSNRRWITTIDIPLAYSKYMHENKAGKTLSDEKILFQPTISNTFQINHYWEMRTRLGYNHTYADDKSLLHHPFFRNYRTIYTPSGILNSNRNYNLNAGLRYKNLLNLLFFNFNMLYRLIDSDYINRSYNTTEASYRTTESYDNTGKQLFLNGDISKTISPLKLTLTLNPNYSHFKSKFIQQDILFSNTSHIASLPFKADLKTIPKITLVYHINGEAIWNDNNLSDRSVLKNLKQKVSFYYFPTKKIDLQATWDHSTYELQKNNYTSFLFIDLVGKFKYKKTEINVMARNLLDTQSYSITHLSTVNSTYQYLPLRGREFLLTFKVNY